MRPLSATTKFVLVLTVFATNAPRVSAQHRTTGATSMSGASRATVAASVEHGRFSPLTRAASLPRVLMRTEKGEIELEIDTVRAPITGKNFLRYVDGRHYDGGRFHRTVRADNQPADSIRIAVIQASADTARRRDGFPPIPLERTSATGLRHTDGCISMARLGPDTATSSFFICVGDQPALDFGGMRNPDGQGFAAFGRVVRGMDVVRAIHALPQERQTLTPAVAILTVTRVAEARQ